MKTRILYNQLESVVFTSFDAVSRFIDDQLKAGQLWGVVDKLRHPTTQVYVVSRIDNIPRQY